MTILDDRQVHDLCSQDILEAEGDPFDPYKEDIERLREKTHNLELKFESLRLKINFMVDLIRKDLP